MGWRWLQAQDGFPRPCRIDLQRDSSRKLGCRDVLYPLHHRTQSVRALWRDVLGKTQPVEHRLLIGFDDLARLAIGKQRERDGNEPAHDMGIGRTAVMDHRIAAALSLAVDPHLADATLHLVCGILLAGGKRLELVAKFDEVFVAVFLVIQEFQILDDFINRHAGFRLAGLFFRKTHTG